MPENDYRLIVFDAPDDPEALRDLYQGVMGLHKAEAMQWVKRSPGIMPWPLAEGEVRELLDGLFEQQIAAEARRVDTVPKLAPARSVHKAECRDEGLSIGGLHGEPAHWVPWSKLELLHAARIDTGDQFRNPSSPGIADAVATGLNALILRRPPGTRPRVKRAQRVVKEPTTELHLVRLDPLIAFRVVADQMNYAYLGEDLSPSAAENFPRFLRDLLDRAPGARATDSTMAVLADDPEAPPLSFPNSQAMLDDTTLRLLWAWYRRDRDRDLDDDDPSTSEHPSPD